jgi:uncharacterized protein YkwD
MGWVKAGTTEMPTVPLSAGRHRRRRRTIGVLVGVVAFGLLIAGALFTPDVTRWLYPPAAGAQAANADFTGAAPPVVAPSASDQVTSTTSPTPARTKATTPTPKAATPAPRRSTPAPPAYLTPTATPMPDLEDAVLTQTNVARADAHCAPLTMESHLLTAARLHSADMAQNDYFSHDTPDGRDPGKRMQAAGYDTSGGWAENIAEGYRTPDAVMHGWLTSQGHRANILNCSLKSIGIGVAVGDNGQLYWTQDFGGR